MRTLRAIEKLPEQNQRPTPEVVISGCGVFTGAVYGKPPAGVDESKREVRGLCVRWSSPSASMSRNFGDPVLCVRCLSVFVFAVRRSSGGEEQQ